MRRVLVHAVIGVVLATLVAQAAGLFAVTDLKSAVARDAGVAGSVALSPSFVVEWRESSGPGRRRLFWRVAERTEYGAPIARLAGVSSFPFGDPMPPSWSRLWIQGGRWGDPMPPGFMAHDGTDFAVGWPLSSFTFELMWSDARWQTQRLNPWVLRGVARAFPAHGSFLPDALRAEPRFVTLNPYWPGLIASSAFWGAVSFVVGTVFGAARSHMLVLRGVCPKCRYDKRGLPGGAACPECGTT